MHIFTPCRITAALVLLKLSNLSDSAVPVDQSFSTDRKLPLLLALSTPTKQIVRTEPHENQLPHNVDISNFIKGIKRNLRGGGLSEAKRTSTSPGESSKRATTDAMKLWELTIDVLELPELIVPNHLSFRMMSNFKVKLMDESSMRSLQVTCLLIENARVLDLSRSSRNRSLSERLNFYLLTSVICGVVCREQVLFHGPKGSA